MNGISPSVQNLMDYFSQASRQKAFLQQQLVMEQEVVDSMFFWPVVSYLWSHSATNYANIYCFL